MKSLLVGFWISPICGAPQHLGSSCFYVTQSHTFALRFCLICETCFSQRRNSPYWDLKLFSVSYLMIQTVSGFDLFPLCACTCVCLTHYVELMSHLSRVFVNNCE